MGNGKPTLMRYSLNGQDIKVNGRWYGDAFSSFVGAAKIKALEIPSTRISNNVGDQNGILAKALQGVCSAQHQCPADSKQFDWYGQLQSKRAGRFHSPRCSSKEFSFQPEAGKDYEVASIVNQQGCAVVVFEVQANGEIKPITQ
jgi:hypothetical protein